MKLRFVFLLFFILPSLLVFAQKKTIPKENLPDYPKYKAVITEFLKVYKEPVLPYPQELMFAKKPDGWHAMIIENGRENKTLKDELFWVKIADTYLQLSFDKTSPTVSLSKEIPDRYLKANTDYFSSILPYWGYQGWDKDVIDTYGDKTNLSDSLLNALARAYASYAANLLNNNSGFSNPEVRFNLPYSQASLSFEQLEIYRKFEHLAIDTYEKLLLLNPRFENHVADIRNVYANEVMNCFLTLRYYKNEDEARKELKPGLYDNFFISLAKNYLASCDTNTVLITNGDGDTFPLLYVQETQGFRRDVLVVNISLLSSPRYIGHLFGKIGKADPLPVCMNQEIYKKGLKDIVYIIKKDSLKNFTDLRQLLTNVASTNKAVKYRSGNQYFDYFPSSLVYLDVDKESLIKNKVLHSADKDSILSRINWNLGNEKVYLSINEFILLDMLACSGFQRPISFAVSIDDEFYLGLQDYFQAEGLTYRILPIFNKSAKRTARINTTQQFEILMKNFAFDPVSNQAIVYSQAHKRFVANYRQQYGLLAEALINKKVNDYALKVLDFCLNQFPSECYPHSYLSILLAENYYRLGENSKANKLVKEIAEFYEKEANDMEKQKDIRPNEYKLCYYVMVELSRLCNDAYPQGKFGQTIQKKIGKIYRIAPKLID